MSDSFIAHVLTLSILWVRIADWTNTLLPYWVL